MPLRTVFAETVTNNISIDVVCTYTGDTGLRGSVGEPGVKGIKGEQGGVACVMI